MTIRLRNNVIQTICESEGGISRDELARRLGVASSTAYRAERGDVEPSPRLIAALMLFTDWPFEALFVIEEAA